MVPTLSGAFYIEQSLSITLRAASDSSCNMRKSANGSEIWERSPRRTQKDGQSSIPVGRDGQLLEVLHLAQAWVRLQVDLDISPFQLQIQLLQPGDTMYVSERHKNSDLNGLETSKDLLQISKC